MIQRYTCTDAEGRAFVHGNRTLDALDQTIAVLPDTGNRTEYIRAITGRGNTLSSGTCDDHAVLNTG